MDLTSIIGLIMGLIAVLVGMVLKGASLSALANPAAAMIILVGTSAAVSIAVPGTHLKRIPKLLGAIFTNKKKTLNDAEILELFVRWATESRKNGLLSLESDLKTIDDEFIKKGLKMVIDGNSAKDLHDILEAEIEAMEERHSKGAMVFTQAGSYAPTLGVLGAVVGLVAALGNLGDIDALGHAIAGAFIATMFGIFVGYVLMHPFSNKLKVKSAEEVAKKQLILQCLLMLQAGTYPFLIESRILGSMSETDRKKIQAQKEDGKK